MLFKGAFCSLTTSSFLGADNLRVPLVTNRQRAAAPVKIPHFAYNRGIAMDGKEGSEPSADWPDLFKRHQGTWEGHYRKINPKTGETTEIHRCKIEVGFRGHRYSQRNTYTWDDGREEVHDFPGILKDGAFLLESGRLKGHCTIIGPDAVVFYAAYKDDTRDIYDIIRHLSDDTLARTWQVREGSEITQLVQVEEKRISTEDKYFEIPDTPWD